MKRVKPSLVLHVHISFEFKSGEGSS